MHYHLYTVKVFCVSLTVPTIQSFILTNVEMTSQEMKNQADKKWIIAMQPMPNEERKHSLRPLLKSLGRPLSYVEMHDQLCNKLQLSPTSTDVDFFAKEMDDIEFEHPQSLTVEEFGTLTYSIKNVANVFYYIRSSEDATVNVNSGVNTNSERQTKSKDNNTTKPKEQIKIEPKQNKDFVLAMASLPDEAGLSFKLIDINDENIKKYDLNKIFSSILSHKHNSAFKDKNITIKDFDNIHVAYCNAGKDNDKEELSLIQYHICKKSDNGGKQYYFRETIRWAIASTHYTSEKKKGHHKHVQEFLYVLIHILQFALQ